MALSNKKIIIQGIGEEVYVIESTHADVVGCIAAFLRASGLGTLKEGVVKSVSRSFYLDGHSKETITVTIEPQE